MLTVEGIVGGTLLDASLAPGAEGIGLPRECYTSQAFYEFEMQTMFSTEWLCLGRADEIPNPGDYFTVTVGADPLIVVRDETGEIHVLSAVCRHRGMVICSDSGNCGGQLVCPYHAWTYNTSGRLTNAPDMQRSGAFDKSRVRLPELRAASARRFRDRRSIDCREDDIFVANSAALIDPHTGALRPGVRTCGSPTDLNCVASYNFAADDPKRYVAKITKSLRKGKIFVDYLRNSLEQTSVAATPSNPTDLRWRSRRLSWSRASRSGACEITGGSQT